MRKSTKATSLSVAVTAGRDCAHGGNNRSQCRGAQDGGSTLHPTQLITTLLLEIEQPIFFSFYRLFICLNLVVVWQTVLRRVILGLHCLRVYSNS